MFLSKKRALVALSLGLVAVLALGLVAPVEASSTNNSTSDSSPDEPGEVADQLGDLVIEGYSYDSDSQTMRITARWEGVTPTEMTAVEMRQMDSGGSQKISFKQIRLIPGETTTLTMTVEQSRDGTASVLISTPESVEQGDALLIQSGSPWWSIGYQSWGVALISGIVATLLTIVLAKKWRDWRAKESVWEVEIK